MAWFARVGGLCQRGTGAISPSVGRSRHLGYVDAVPRLRMYSNEPAERARTYSSGLWRWRGVEVAGAGPRGRLGGDGEVWAGSRAGGSCKGGKRARDATYTTSP